MSLMRVQTYIESGFGDIACIFRSMVVEPGDSGVRMLGSLAAPTFRVTLQLASPSRQAATTAHAQHTGQTRRTPAQ